MTKKYNQLPRKAKQLIASEYPYKSDIQLFDSSLGGSFKSNKFFDNRKQLMEFKEEAANEDVSLQKRRDFVTGSVTTSNSDTISIIDMVLNKSGEDAYRDAIELAQHDLDPLDISKGLLGIQLARLKQGVEYEREANLGLSQEVEGAMSNAISLNKLINEIINGKKLDVQVEGSLSSMIMNMELDDQDFEEDEEYIDISGGSKDDNGESL